MLDTNASSDFDSFGVSVEMPTPQVAVRRPSGTRSRSWALEARPGAYAAVVAWHSGEAWFDALMDALSTAQGNDLRRAARVSVGTLLRVARADWLSADARTGRGVATSHETVAVALGMSAKTVYRARRLMENLGYSETVEEGRYLTRAERVAAYETHGMRQIKAASLRALTLPRPQPVENVYLPRRGDVPVESPVQKNSPKRARAHKMDAPRPASAKMRSKARSNIDSRRPRPIVEQIFAAKLVEVMPWLGRAKHIGAVSAMLDRAGVDAQRWTVDTLRQTVESYRSAHRINVPEVSSQRDPLAYFGWLLGKAIDPAAETMHERRQRERRARLEATEAERLAEAERVAAIDWAEAARIVEESNRQIAARNRERAQAERAERARREQEQLAELVRRGLVRR